MPRKSEIAKQAISKADTQILNVFAKEVQQEKDFGVFAVTMDKVKTMYNAGLISFDEMLTLSSWCIIGNYFYKLNKALKAEKDTSSYEIDTSRLHIGMILKNYRQLCEVIGISPKTGKERALQEKMIQRYIEYEKIVNSNKIIILDIYDEPMKPPHYRNAKFINQLKILILHLIANIESQDDKFEQTIIRKTTYSKLMKSLNIVNSYFFNKSVSFCKYFFEKYPNLFDKNADIHTKNNFWWNYTLFCSIVLRKIKSSISSALASLEKDDMIAVQKDYIIIPCDANEPKRKANSAELAYLKQIRKEIANEMGYKNSNNACFYKSREFTSKLQERIQNEKKWFNVYYEITISITYANLYKHINEYTAIPLDKPVCCLSLSELQEIRQNYSNTLQNAVHEQADNMGETKTKSLAKRLKNNTDNNLTDLTIDEIISSFELRDNMTVKDYFSTDFKSRMYSLSDTLIPISMKKSLDDYFANCDKTTDLNTEWVDFLEAD